MTLSPRVKFWINFVTTAILIAAIWIFWPQIVSAFGKLREVNVWLLLLIIPVQILSYHAIGELYYGFFRRTGGAGKLRIRQAIRIAMELNFVNNVLPSGGVSGFSYLSMRFKPFGISVASITLAHIMRFGLLFVSFLVLLGFGVIALSVQGGANGLAILISTSIFFLTAFIVGLGMYIISSKSRINGFVTFLPKILNSVLKLFHRKRKKDVIDIKKVEETLNELNERFVALKANIGSLKQPFWAALRSNFFEVLTVYIVFLAFGELVNPGAVILAYSIANFAGLVAILPGGAGVYEALMIGVLSAVDVPQAIAISVTLVYRVIMTVIFVPVGYFFYHRALATKQIEEPIRGRTT